MDVKSLWYSLKVMRCGNAEYLWNLCAYVTPEKQVEVPDE